MTYGHQQQIWQEAQKGEYYFGIKLNIKHSSHDTNKFKLALRKFLLTGSFYFCDGYFEWNLRSDHGAYLKCNYNMILVVIKTTDYDIYEPMFNFINLLAPEFYIKF